MKAQMQSCICVLVIGEVGVFYLFQNIENKNKKQTVILLVV